MKKVLVIGGSGFVGLSLIPVLQKAGHEVTVLNRGNRPISNANQIVADRNDVGQMCNKATSFDVVIDTSAYTKEQAEIALLAFGPSVKKWIHLSSAAVYRETPGRFPDETDAIGGAQIWGQYGRDKSAADKYLLAKTSLPVIILRPPYLYGPNNAYDRETFIWARAISGRPIIVPSDGTTQIQFLHVHDLAAIFQHFVENEYSENAVYNIAAPRVLNTKSWARDLAELTNTEFDIISGQIHAADVSARSYFPFRDYDCALDTNKLTDQLDWKPFLSFQEGFKQTLSSYDLSKLMKMSPSTNAELQIISNIHKQ